MSRLEDLIAKLCPDGVEYRPLKDISDMQRGTAITKKQSQNGEYPVISGGKEPAYYCDKYNRDGETISVSGSGAGAGFVNYWNQPVFIADAFSIKGKSNISLTRYLYHCLEKLQDKIYATQKGGGVPHVHISSIENFLIPVPPIEVQREIVRILDSFTELQSELQSELQARKQQYEYYRDMLLSCNENLSITKNVTWYSIDDLCFVSAGGDAPKGAISKEKNEIYNIPIISNGVGQNAIYGYTNIAKISVPSVTVAARGTIGYAEYRDYSYYPIIRLLSVSPKDTKMLNTKFLFYVLQDKKYDVPISGIPQLTVPKLRKIQIPIPPLEVQQRIVSILDRFDALCNDLTAGIPAEIEARQKQYEYYRDKLLNFKRKQA